MSSTSEKGHAKNIANFTDLINICAAFGTKYNPSRDDLKIAALQALLVSAEQGQSKLNNAIPPYSTAVALKDEAFAPLSKTITRVMSAFKSSKPMEGEVLNATTLARKIKGEAKSKKAANEAQAGAAAEKTEHVSVSQMSMDMRIENMNRLVEVLQANSKYAPNEPELQVTSLKAFTANLKALSEAVVVAGQPVIDARIGRNELLYQTNTGLVAIAEDVKLYLKSAFGAASPQYKQVSKITFSKQKL